MAFPFKSALGAASILLMAVGCTAPTEERAVDSPAEVVAAEQGSDSVAANQAALDVVTTFLPMTHFTKAVAGDRAQVTQLLPPSVDPHDYQARPQDVQRIAEADVLVKNGLEFESFLTSLIENADNDALVVVDSSEGTELLAAVEGHDDAHGDDHSKAHHDDHGDDEHEEHGHGDEHGDEEHGHDDEHGDEDHDEHGHEDHADDDDKHSKAHDGHDHGENDPHIWLDPKKAIQQVENIRDALIAADPDGEAVYTQNAADYIDELSALDKEITTALAPYADQTFVTYHDFAAHFAQSYDLEVEYLVDVPEDNAAPADVRRVMEVTQASNLKTLLAEVSSEGSPFEAIAKDLKVEVSVFDPIETGPGDGEVSGSAEPDYYVAVMRQNVKNLQAAFGSATGAATGAAADE